MRTHSSSYVCQLHDQIILRPACKCSQRALSPARATAEWRGPEVVQWSQHSKIFVWVHHCLMCFCCCALNVWWGTRHKTGRNRKEQSFGSLSQKVTGLCCQGNSLSLRTQWSDARYQSNQTSEGTSATQIDCECIWTSYTINTNNHTQFAMIHD